MREQVKVAINVTASVVETNSVMAVSDVMCRLAAGEEITRADVEVTAWRVCGWRSEQALVDELMAVVDAYVTSVTADPGEAVVATADPGDEPPVTPVSLVALDEVVAKPGDGDGLVTCTKCRVAKDAGEYGKDGKRH